MILLAIALRAQPVQLPGHSVAQPPQISSTGDRTPAETNANSTSSHSAMTKEGTTSISSPAKQPTTAPQQSQPASVANNPCARASKPSPMCPVAAP